MEVGANTDIGLRKSINEDAYKVWYASIDGEERGFFAVADGVGGEEKGEVASKETLERIFHRIQPLVFQTEKPDAEDIKDALIDSIKLTNTEILDIAKEDDLGKIATTLTMGIMLGEFLAVANVGDSRTYLLRDEELELITKDHSLIEHLVTKGKLDSKDVEVPRSEKAKMHENVVTRAIGDKEVVEVDIFTKYLRKGDTLMLCCDGLTDLVTTESIREIMISSKSTGECCERLIRAANEESGKDNITVIVVKPDHLPSREDVINENTLVKE